MGCHFAKVISLQDTALNILFNGWYDLSYIVESADWIIKQVGVYVTRCLNCQGELRCRLSTETFGLRGQTIHFGSINTFIGKYSARLVHPKNQIVVTWFHVTDQHRTQSVMMDLVRNRVDVIHTASQRVRKDLMSLGLDDEKIVVIPLGIDLSLFHPLDTDKRLRYRQSMGIPPGRMVIGSFQKDGEGWGKGLQPKLIKGPDVFVEVVNRLAAQIPVYVLLAGPSRGYMENELRRQGIPFRSMGYYRNYQDIVGFYNALDLYLITSRLEGGPQQMQEAWASRVPVVSTRVGLIPDLGTDGQDVLLAEVDDVDRLTTHALRIFQDVSLSQKLVENGAQSVLEYDWSRISRQYWEKLYRPLRR